MSRGPTLLPPGGAALVACALLAATAPVAGQTEPKSQPPVEKELAQLPAGVKEERVLKPVNGGGYCEPLADVLERTRVKDGRVAAPAIVQHRLTPPEVSMIRHS